LEIDPPKRLVLKWRNEYKPEKTAEGYSRMTFELEPKGERVKLSLPQEMDRGQSKFIEAVSGGWPDARKSPSPQGVWFEANGSRWRKGSLPGFWCGARRRGI